LIFFFCIALFRRASCHLAKQENDEAKRDLDILLIVDPENTEAKVRVFFINNEKDFR
jgi:hypothetical protein